MFLHTINQEIIDEWKMCGNFEIRIVRIKAKQTVAKSYQICIMRNKKFVYEVFWCVEATFQGSSKYF